jgi:hypothetical protein
MNIWSHCYASESRQTQVLEDASLAVQWTTCLMRTGASHFTGIVKQFLDLYPRVKQCGLLRLGLGLYCRMCEIS